MKYGVFVQGNKMTFTSSQQIKMILLDLPKLNSFTSGEDMMHKEGKVYLSSRVLDNELNSRCSFHKWNIYSWKKCIWWFEQR